MTTKAQALRTLTAQQDRLERDSARVVVSAEKRDAAVLAAQTAGASYADMEDATGLSTARITQVLRRARNRANPFT